MTESDLIQWKVRCTGAGNHGEQVIWLYESDGLPTHCPLNNTDPINPDNIREVDRKTSNSVKIDDENGVTGGRFHSTSRKMTITDSAEAQHFVYSIPFDISIFHIRFMSEEAHRGDEVEMSVAPLTPIGKIMQNVIGGSEGDIVIHIQAQTLPIVAIGYYISLKDDTRTDHVGRIVAIDSVASTITVEKPPSRTYSSTGTGSSILLTVKFASEHYIGPPMMHGLGETNFASSFVKKDHPMDITYINNTGLSKELIVYIDYKY